MDERKVDERAKSIELKSPNKNEFFLVHGYTGSPTDFRSLPENLHKQFNANVRVIRLAGHGTNIDELNDLTVEDFIRQVEKEIESDLHKGRKIVIGGISFGAQIALYIASKYPVKGVFSVSVPYKMKFPFNIPFLGLLGLFKKKWRKRISKLELKLRKINSFHYKEMHANGLSINKKASKINEKNMKKISAPLLNIHSKKEPIGHYKSVKYIEKNTNSLIKKNYILKQTNHNVFYSEDEKYANKVIIEFFKKNKIFQDKKKESIAAVVPAYNEGDRIEKVLKVLSKTKILDQIIVVDDGSNDNTKDVIKKFKKIKYIRNKKNMGKGYSMDIGVKESKADIIFFCDADLINLTPDIVEKSIMPVLNNEVDMFIAMRGNFMQKAIKLFGINSGERALRREIWESLPKYYKHRYRIEAGLNYYVKKYGRGLGYKIFSHSQPIKEKKYGLLKGTLLRWWMNFDVMSAYVSCFFMKPSVKKVN
ncbi:MAG: alpha/beta fold hydrolase [Nanoarchaeota archaeon]